MSTWTVAQFVAETHVVQYHSASRCSVRARAAAWMANPSKASTCSQRSEPPGSGGGTTGSRRRTYPTFHRSAAWWLT